MQFIKRYQCSAVQCSTMQFKAYWIDEACKIIGIETELSASVFFLSFDSVKLVNLLLLLKNELVSLLFTIKCTECHKYAFHRFYVDVFVFS